MSSPRASRLGGLLCMASGLVFIVLGMVGPERDLVRLFAGIALLAVGIVWSRPAGKREPRD